MTHRYPADWPDIAPTLTTLGSPSGDSGAARIALNYADINQVIPVLEGQWAIGQLEFKVFSPAPRWDELGKS